jgi:hypothetical protein
MCVNKQWLLQHRLDPKFQGKWIALRDGEPLAVHQRRGAIVTQLEYLKVDPDTTFIDRIATNPYTET